jgi:two-component system phosphate regulon response regulator PhoB/two-component system alkaline phosphatase synthesis response regulator PhoP
MNKTIAIVDDEKDIVELVSINLTKNNFKSLEFYDAKSFLDSLKAHKPDLLLLDLMLPDIDGIEVCKTLRSNEDYKDMPIIMLTARQDETDKIIGLEIGADDYITKPFSPRELIARIKALLRRSSILQKQSVEEKIINIDNKIFIDIKKHEVHDNEKNKIFLTSTEFNLLLILNEKRGWVFSREKLLNKLWGEDKYVIDRTIDVHIKNLREKLGAAGQLIKNIRGVGYKLDYEI